MENFSFRRGLLPFLGLAFLFAGCGKKTENAATPAPGGSASAPQHESLAGGTPAPVLTGAVTPVVVTQGPGSFSHYLHFPSGVDASKSNSVVQFYCDVTEQGMVEAVYGLVGNDEAFKAAVQSALDWGRFAPATVNGNPVAAYIGGTVIFARDQGQPVIVVSLATHDRDRVGHMANYIQPQILGGLRREVAKIVRQIPHSFPVSGISQALAEVDEKGVLKKVSIVGETPKGSGLGDLLGAAIKGAQFTHAYENGKAVAGSVDVVADFSKL